MTIAIVIPTIKRHEAESTAKLAKLTAGCDVNIIISEDAHHRGFSKTVNAGLQQTTTEDVCILNDDIEWFSYGWLEIMHRALHSSFSYGIVGPSGRSSTAPMRHGWAGMRGIKEVDHIPFWCALIKRGLFDKIGYLNDSLIHYGSDNLFCWTAAERGMLCIWTRDVYLKHTHHGSGLILEWKEHDDLVLEKKLGKRKRPSSRKRR